MVELSKKKIENLLFGLYSYLGISKEEVSKYADEIVEIAKYRSVTSIPRKGSYVIKVEGRPIAYFVNGKMYVGNWESPLHGDLYIIGATGYIKFEERVAKYRKTEPYEKLLSKVQLLVQPKEDKIEIVNVGVRKAEVTPIEEMGNKNREKKENWKLWVLLFLFIIPPFHFLLPTAKTGSFVVPSAPIPISISILISLLALLIIYKTFRK